MVGKLFSKNSRSSKSCAAIHEVGNYAGISITLWAAPLTNFLPGSISLAGENPQLRGNIRCWFCPVRRMSRMSGSACRTGASSRYLLLCLRTQTACRSGVAAPRLRGAVFRPWLFLGFNPFQNAISSGRATCSAVAGECACGGFLFAD